MPREMFLSLPGARRTIPAVYYFARIFFDRACGLLSPCFFLSVPATGRRCQFCHHARLQMPTRYNLLRDNVVQ